MDEGRNSDGKESKDGKRKFAVRGRGSISTGDARAVPAPAAENIGDGKGAEDAKYKGVAASDEGGGEQKKRNGSHGARARKRHTR